MATMLLAADNPVTQGCLGMFLRFLKDVRGNYVLLTAISMVPIMGGLAIAIDYTELTRQRAATISALDAAGIATARYIASGTGSTEPTAVYEAGIKLYAKEFFEANLGASILPTPR